MKRIGTKSLVNFTSLSFLFTLCVFLHLAVTVVSPAHPSLRTGLTALEATGWIGILLLWMLLFHKHVPAIRIHLSRWWASTALALHTRTRTILKRNDPFAEVCDLSRLRDAVNRLYLALYGMTPELERARVLSYQQRREAVPPLSLPPQHATHHAEFMGIMALLTHYGFPAVESVRLRKPECMFVQQWVADLHTRFLHASQSVLAQRHALYAELTQAWHQHRALCLTSGVATTESDQALQAVFSMLEKLTQDPRCPVEVVREHLPALYARMEEVGKQSKQASGSAEPARA